jgi:ABC-2 type transport system permease protein
MSESQNASASVAGYDGEGYVYRRDYERYDGLREGRQRSYRAVIGHSVRRALGIRRKWTAKIIPFILYAAAFLPVIGFISIQALFGTDIIQFGSADLFAALSLVLLIFAAAASPEMLCDDRRERVLQLYYSRGMTRSDYLLAKLIALGTLMLSISLVPALILFLGNMLLDDSPLRYLGNNLGEVARILTTSMLLSIYFASIGLAISAITLRKGIASAIYIGLFLITTPIVIALFETIKAGWSRYLLLLAPLEIPEGIISFALAVDPQPGSLLAQAGIDGWWYLVSVAVVSLGSAAILYRRYLAEDSA